MNDGAATIENNTTKQLVKLTTPTGITSDGNLEIKIWSPSERRMRAVKYLFITWFFALIALLIPVVHPFLFPVLLILGPILAKYAYKQTSCVIGGKGVCPYCSKDFEIVSAKDKWPIQDICGNCHQHVEITKV